MILQQHDKKSTRTIHSRSLKIEPRTELDMMEKKIKQLVIENSGLQKVIEAKGKEQRH